MCLVVRLCCDATTDDVTFGSDSHWATEILANVFDLLHRLHPAALHAVDALDAVDELFVYHIKKLKNAIKGNMEHCDHETYMAGMP